MVIQTENAIVSCMCVLALHVKRRMNTNRMVLTTRSLEASAITIQNRLSRAAAKEQACLESAYDISVAPNQNKE